MATYNKRGFKSPKAKEVDDSEENVDIDAKDSTTAEVFNTLDVGASKAEEWVVKNQKYIFGVVGTIAFVTVAFLLYQKFIVEPKQLEAADEMFVAQQNFQKAVDATTGQDSLFNLALNGAEGKFGFIKIAEEYSGTDAGNLANYYAGIAYLNTGKNTEAIAYLDKFSSDDMILSTLAQGAIGDAFAQKNQLKEALDYYKKAAEMNVNDLTTPRFLLKAGQTAYTLGQKADALKYFTEIKEKYESAPEARNIDGLIGMAQ
ncbi:tetratricopeptide repeat protein [Flavobacterium lacus]|uniref:Tetratricopeptide repeat protein n=1 Tax=Flavobacterium lacus TaxID=1353778 RepID=A0A328WKE3_9FLAO|nr:tetratricopeptide repeat protein [Flavobacterium lacus]RAR46832.1 tetratricopeptide repeat protein [Flavobacterium lacus]